MASGIEAILETHERVVEDGETAPIQLRYKNYVVSTLRGGVGKTSLAFNLAYEFSRVKSTLVVDLCPQCNLTENILGGKHSHVVNVYDAMRPRVLGPAFGDEIEDFSFRVGDYRDSFKGGKRCYFVPGSAELFSFPSAMYQQLQQAIGFGNPGVVDKLLRGLQDVLVKEAKDKNCELILMDTSPFYAGGTHMAWAAADAIIIPVRVDENSIDSLDLTFKMLVEPGRDFQMWNRHAKRERVPRVAAIVMTMVGPFSRTRARPDRASCMYIERALKTAEKYRQLFDAPEPSDVFVITNDFASAGRVSGADGIPISCLQSGKFHTVAGKRLQVNASVTRYQRQLRHLVSIL